MKVGIIDILSTPVRSFGELAYGALLTKQYASITPQAIAVWCRRHGHRTHYAVYYGLGDPRRLLPDDLDVVFVSTYTQASGLAYAIAKLWRSDGVRTVVGGPHAKSFPADCRRFFDIVVIDSNQALIEDVVADRFAPGSVVSARRPFRTVPSVEERWPELAVSAFARGRPYFSTTVPFLASIGCPYTCDFCIDATNPWRELSLDQLAADLRWIASRFPRVMYGFHDPNFAIRFDVVMDVLESIPRTQRLPYIVESSLSVLRGPKIARLKSTNCAVMAPGIESWADYGNKSGGPQRGGAEKVNRVVEQFTALSEYVPYLQANFLFGVDADQGREPIALTKEFMARTPFVWPVVNVPHPFGGTPAFERQRREGRLLESMPFGFYYSPYLASRPLHYRPIEYYEGLIELFSFLTSREMLMRRLEGAKSAYVRCVHLARTHVKRKRLGKFRDLLKRLQTDQAFLAFHEGRTTVLPEFYHREYERDLGRFGLLMSAQDRTPTFDSVTVTAV